MCYHVSLEDQKQVAGMQKPIRNHEVFKPKYQFSGFEKPFLPVISILNPSEIDMYRWRLVPTWVTHENQWKANTLNARNDELFNKPSYKDFWRNRCLVMCTGFFEPHCPAGTSHSQSWYIKPKEGGLFTLGGIFSKWKEVYTFSIITTDASPLMAQVHNEGQRMPLILEDENAEKWLQKDLTQQEMEKLMLPYPHDQRLITYRVLDGVFNARADTNVPEVLLPHPSKSKLNEGGTLSLF
tara:strand:- start:20 stop:736 length:717 start_codon:yes stop_codon:yes gene_type:complete